MKELPDMHERRKLDVIAPARPTISEILEAKFENLPYVEPPVYKNKKEADRASEDFQERNEMLMNWFDVQNASLSEEDRAKLSKATQYMESDQWGAWFMHCQAEADKKRRLEKQKIKQKKKQLTMKPA